MESVLIVQSLPDYMTTCGHLLDKLVQGHNIDLDAIYFVFLLLLVPVFAGQSQQVLSTNGQFYSKLYKLVVGELIHGCGFVLKPEVARQQSRTEQVTSVSPNNREIPNDTVISDFRGDTLPLSDSTELSPKFYTSPPTSPSNSIPNRTESPTQCDDDDHCTSRKRRNTDSSGSSSTVRAGVLDSGEYYSSLGRQQCCNGPVAIDTELNKSASLCAVQGQDETVGVVRNERFVTQAGSDTTSGAQDRTAASSVVPTRTNNSPPLSGHSAQPTKSTTNHQSIPGHGDEGAVKRTSGEILYPVQESGLPCSSDIVVTVPEIPRRIGLVIGSELAKLKLTSDSGNSSLPKLPRATEGASSTLTAAVQPTPYKWTKPPKGGETGCILYSNIAAFEEGSFLPLPSREAVERSIGKGGNGTISIVYFKGLEFAVKRTHFRQMEVEIQSSLCHDNILPLQAVMMGEEDPQRPSRFLCYHFMPRMSGDLQSYLTKVGHGALSNLLMQHKEDPTMLQLVVDNTKHILRSILKGLAYLHSSHIVHNDVKPSNFLTATQCGCVSPLTCDHGQRFAVKLSDFDSAMDVTKVWTRHSVLRQLYRNNPTGTPGYRPPEYVLVATRTPDELDADTLTAADVWAFGCSVLKIFLSHSGPHTQKQMAFLHLWHNGGCPWEREGERAREELKLGLLERVYPNWPHLWAFVGECMKVSPKDRMKCNKLIEHPFFTS